MQQQKIIEMLRKRDKAHDEEIDQFNDGFESYKNGVSICDQPYFESDQDVWRIGWVWAKWNDTEFK